MTPETAHRLLDEVDYELERKASPGLPRNLAARYTDPDNFALEQQPFLKC